jgi:hypothetical protein
MTDEHEKTKYPDGAYFTELAAHYRTHPIAIYTGAGVSAPDKSAKKAPDGKDYGIESWERLLREILMTAPVFKPTDVAEFERDISITCRDEPWRMADWVADRVGGPDTFKRCVVRLFQHTRNFPDRGARRKKRVKATGGKKQYKQLSGTFVSASSTLSAACAFCAQLDAYVEGARANTYRVLPNRRVRAVVTTNYDPFLEAAFSSMFIEPRLKPVGARGSHAGAVDQIPVFHIHGYVKYPRTAGEERERELEAWVDPVVTTTDYEKAWEERDAFKFTMGAQIHVLRHYCTLFIGFSFRDRWVNDLLRRLREERERHDRAISHYAIMKKSSVDAAGALFFADLGVKPIAVDDYPRIPECLGRLYQEGLKGDHGSEDVQLRVIPKGRRKAGPLDAASNPLQSEGLGVHPMKTFGLSWQKYWEELCTCRDCHAAQPK